MAHSVAWNVSAAAAPFSVVGIGELWARVLVSALVGAPASGGDKANLPHRGHQPSDVEAVAAAEKLLRPGGFAGRVGDPAPDESHTHAVVGDRLCDQRTQAAHG